MKIASKSIDMTQKLTLAFYINVLEDNITHKNLIDSYKVQFEPKDIIKNNEVG